MIYKPLQVFVGFLSESLCTFLRLLRRKKNWRRRFPDEQEVEVYVNFMKREFSSSLQWDSFWNATTEFTSTSAHSYSRKRFEPCFTKKSVLKVHWTRVITGLTPWKKALQGICLSPSFHCSRSKVPSPPFWKQGDGIPVFILELFFFSLSYIGLPVSIFGVDQDNRSVGIYRLWTELLQCQEFAIGSHLNIEQKKTSITHVSSSFHSNFQ